MRTINFLLLSSKDNFLMIMFSLEHLQESHDVSKGCSHSVWHTQLYGRDGVCSRREDNLAESTD